MVPDERLTRLYSVALAMQRVSAKRRAKMAPPGRGMSLTVAQSRSDLPSAPILPKMMFFLRTRQMLIIPAASVPVPCSASSSSRTIVLTALVEGKLRIGVQLGSEKKLTTPSQRTAAALNGRSSTIFSIGFALLDIERLCFRVYEGDGVSALRDVAFDTPDCDGKLI